MSAAPEFAAPHPFRPALRIVHLQEPPELEFPAVRDDWAQEELPLPWRSVKDRSADDGSGLACYPSLPLVDGIPRPDPHIALIAALLADVLIGARSATQLARVASLDLQQRLARRAARLAGRPRWSGRGAQVTSTNAMTVAPTVVLVAVVFLVGGRAHAAAIRMEYRHGRWLATDVDSPV